MTPDVREQMTAIHSNQFEFSMRLTGSSMNPTLKPHDILQVVPYIGRKIRGGDVIVFLPPGSNRKVTHRVLLLIRILSEPVETEIVTSIRGFSAMMT